MTLTIALLGFAAAAPVRKARPAGTQIDGLGPGAGPWTVASPESQGLDGEQLRIAEERVNDEMGERLCCASDAQPSRNPCLLRPHTHPVHAADLVVKNGVIVHGTYRRGHTESSLHAGWSTTKTLCAGLYGVAVEQGWADVEDLVRERNGGDTRQCDADATFRTVLSMTARSSPPGSQFDYDASGQSCLDTLADFIHENSAPVDTSSSPSALLALSLSSLRSVFLRYVHGVWLPVPAQIPRASPAANGRKSTSSRLSASNTRSGKMVLAFPAPDVSPAAGVFKHRAVTSRVRGKSLSTRECSPRRGGGMSR